MSRKELIVETARKLIVSDGLYDTSIGKIAKAASIPVGSVYTYFSSKEELINYTYLSVKLEMGSYIFAPIGKDLTLKEELKCYWSRAIEFGVKHSEKFFFIEQFANSPMISKTSQDQVQQEFARVFFLFEKGILDGTLKKLDVFILHSIVYSNIIGTIKFLAAGSQAVNDELLDSLFTCCWDSIRSI